MSNIYLKQLSLGSAQNFIYLIGDASTRDCLVIDPAWEVQAIRDQAASDGMTIQGIALTHSHHDHCNGARALQRELGLPLYLHPAELGHMKQPFNEVTLLSDGASLRVGELAIRVLHTPGHTPGGLCFLLEDLLITGDTLFVGGCGRCDLPGGSGEQMYESLHEKIGQLPPETRILPGHDYGSRPVSTIKEELAQNPYFLQKDKKAFIGYRMSPS